MSVYTPPIEPRREVPSAYGEPGPVADEGPHEVSQLAYARPPGAPSYPGPALRARQDGVVVRRTPVAAHGVPPQVGVARPRADSDLRRAAIDYALKRLRFKPAERDGRPVAAIARVPVDFRLPGRA